MISCRVRMIKKMKVVTLWQLWFRVESLSRPCSSLTHVTHKSSLLQDGLFTFWQLDYFPRLAWAILTFKRIATEIDKKDSITFTLTWSGDIAKDADSLKACANVTPLRRSKCVASSAHDHSRRDHFFQMRWIVARIWKSVDLSDRANREKRNMA